MFLGAFKDPEMASHLTNVPDLYLWILACAVFAEGKGREDLPVRCHAPVMLGGLAAIAWRASV
jgi:hypothetical protein